MSERAIAGAVAPRTGFGTQVRSVGGKSGGAALTEFFYLTIILVPLLFGTAMIGKLIDVRQTAVQASRYVAWESTVDGPDETADDVAARFFTDRASALSAAPGGDAATRAADTNALWGRGARTEAGLLEETRVTVDHDHVMASADGSARAPTMARSMGDVVVEAGGILNGASGGRWDLEADGFLRRGVTVPVEGNGWLSRHMGGCGADDAYACLTELSVIMTDDWSASDGDEAKTRIKSLVPAGALRTVSNLVAGAGELPVLKELKGLSGALGAVNVKALPETEKGVRTLGDYVEGEGP